MPAGYGGTPSAYREPRNDPNGPEYRVGQLSDPLNDPLDGPRPPSPPASPGEWPGSAPDPDPFGTPRFGGTAPGDTMPPDRSASPGREEALDRYDDELSRPGRSGPDSSAAGPPPSAYGTPPDAPGYPEYGAPAGDRPQDPLGAPDRTRDLADGFDRGTPNAPEGARYGEHTGAQGPAAGAPTESGLGTGSGNTWAFSRNDYTLQDLRKAAMDAVEMQRSDALDQDPPSSQPGFGPETGPSPGQAPPVGGTGAPTGQPGDQYGEGRGGPEGWPPDAPATPDAGDPLGAIAAEQARGRAAEGAGPEQGSGSGPDAFGAAAPAPPPAEGTQAMPAVSDELGPDHRGGAGSAGGAPGYPGDPAPQSGPGYGPYPDPRPGEYASGGPTSVEGRAEPAAPSYGPERDDDYDAVPGYGDAAGPADPYGAPVSYDTGYGEYGHGALAERRYGDGLEDPGYGGYRGYESGQEYREHDDYRGRDDEAYQHGGVREYDGDEGYDGYGELPAEEDRGGNRGPVGQDFPDFGDGPLGGDTGDPYPGYDNLDIDYWPETDRGATVTMWLGILALVPVLGLLGVIGVFVLGPKARTRIRRSGGEMEGENLVRIGTILAYVGIAITVLAALWGAASFVTGG